MYNDLHIEYGIERQGKMAFEKERVVIKGQLICDSFTWQYLVLHSIYLFILFFFLYYFFSLFVRNYLIEDIA